MSARTTLQPSQAFDPRSPARKRVAGPERCDDAEERSAETKSHTRQGRYSTFLRASSSARESGGRNAWMDAYVEHGPPE